MRLIIKTLAFISILFCQPAMAQYTQVGNGGFQSFTYGPMSTVDSSGFYNRHAYIYPSGSISNLSHGDTIRSIEFMRGGFDTLRGNCNFKIYIKNTYKADFGAGSINWLSETRDSGMTLLYNKNPKDEIGSTPGFVKFDFNEAPYYVFDTSGAAIHLQVLVEYTQQTNQPNPISWYNESSFYVPAFVSNNEAKYLSGGVSSWLDSISTSSFQIKPTVRFNHPDKLQNIEVRNVYALGRVPIKMNRADSVKAIVENIGRDTLFSHKVYLEVTGVNTYTDSITIDTLVPSEEIMIVFGDYLPAQQGNEFLTVRAAMDDDPSDNSTTYRRIVNYNIYTHSDPFSSNIGGIGFNGSSGDFVGKFYVDQTDRINQVKVDFSSTGRSYQIGIWDDNGAGGLPGTNLYTSDTLSTVPGTNIYNLDSTVTVNGGYYVGVRQTSNTNVAFSYQAEVPVRPHTFYFAAPLGDTNWVSFSPGFNYNFNIQPRLQVANDMAIEDIIVPDDGEQFEYSTTDSLFPKVAVSNFGTADQFSVLVNLRIVNRFGQSIYSSDRIIDLASEDSVWLNFDPFSLYNLGDFTAIASVDLNVDSVKDNNTLEHTFELYKNHDVAADIIFEPSAGDSFEIKQDGFWPQVRVFNYGIIRQVNFPVTAQLVDDSGNVFHSESQLVSLDGGSSVILVFDSIFPQNPGWQNFIVFTNLFRDSFPENDTVSVRIYGKKSKDMAIKSIVDPEPEQKYATQTDLRPYYNITNVGLEPQDSVLCLARIYGPNGLFLYQDTLYRDVSILSSSAVLFDPFYTGTRLGRYRVEFEVQIEGDQDESNDTASRYFNVVNGRDLMIISIDTPENNALYAIGSSEKPVQFKIYNNGIVDANNALFEILIKEKGGTLYFIDTIQNVSISTEDTLTLRSKELDYLQGGEYDLQITNLWQDEELRSTDDTARLSYIVKYQKDISVQEHIYPYSPYDANLRTELLMSFRLRNIGIDSSVNESLVVWVNDPFNAEYYRDTLSWSTLRSEESRVLDLTLPIVSNEIGLHTVYSALMASDDNSENDTFQSTFSLKRYYDIAVDSAVLPKQDFTQLVKTSLKPQCYVSNQGLLGVDSIYVYCVVSVSGIEIYADEVIIDLDSGTSMLVSFDSSLRYPDYALARSLFYVSFDKDLSYENDTLDSEFYFSDKLNIPSVKGRFTKVYPNPSGALTNISSSKPMQRVEIFNELGELVLLKAVSNDYTVAVNSQQLSGVYTAKVYSGNSIDVIRFISL